MENAPVEFRKRREIGEVITASFDFLRSEWKPLLKLTVIYVLPFILALAVVQVFIQIKLTGAIQFLNEMEPERLLREIGPIYLNLFIMMFFNLFVQSLYVAAIYSYIHLYIEKGRGNFSIAEVSQLLFSNSLMAFIANLLFAGMFMIGLLFCILPGIYLANSLSLAVMIFLFEKRGLGYSFSKSWYLVKQQWWNTLALNLLGLIILWMVNLVFSIPAMLTGISSLFSGAGDGVPAEFPNWYWVLTGMAQAATSLVMVVSYVFIAFQYFNLEEQQKTSLPNIR